MAEDNWVRSTIRFPRQLHSSLKTEASHQGRTIEDLVRSAVERELNGPVESRFSDTPQGNERRTLRELERSLQDNLDKIRNTLAVSEPSGDDVLSALADRFLDCLPVPVLIRDVNGDSYWKNPAYLKMMSDSDEEENLADLDRFTGRQGGFCIVTLKANTLHAASEKLPFDSWQFRFSDDDGKEYMGDLLLPHSSVESAMRGQGVLLSLPSLQVASSVANQALLICQAAFLKKLPISAVIKDLGGRYQWANSAMLKEVRHEREWNEIAGKRLVEWWFPTEEAKKLADAVDEQEDLVKAKKMGYLVATVVDEKLTRPGLRFPLLDNQNRILSLGTLGIGPPIIFKKTHLESNEVAN